MRNPFRLVLVLLLTLGLAVAQETEQQTQEERERTIAQIIAEHPDLTTFYEILQSGNLLETFAEQAALEAGEAGEEGLTVFAPTNAAFDGLSEAELEALRSDPQALLVAHHVEQEPFTLDSLRTQPSSEEFTHVVESDDAGNLIISNARIIEGDLMASNGVVHIIDQLLVTDDVLRAAVEDREVAGGGAGEEGAEETTPNGEGDEASGADGAMEDNGDGEPAETPETAPGGGAEEGEAVETPEAAEGDDGEEEATGSENQENSGQDN